MPPFGRNSITDSDSVPVLTAIKHPNSEIVQLTTFASQIVNIVSRTRNAACSSIAAPSFIVKSFFFAFLAILCHDNDEYHPVIGAEKEKHLSVQPSNTVELVLVQERN